jgi:hypothetical protein
MLIIIVIVVLAIFLLRGFDRIAGRGPQQVKDGINQSILGSSKSKRIPCSRCAEMIMPTAKKCPFCKSDL